MSPSDPKAIVTGCQGNHEKGSPFKTYFISSRFLHAEKCHWHRISNRNEFTFVHRIRYIDIIEIGLFVFFFSVCEMIEIDRKYWKTRTKIEQKLA